MNVKYFIIGWLCFNSCWSLGQDVVLLTQTEVDAFDSSITSINGDLLIGPSNNIDRILDLSNLSNVESISGDFHLQSLHHIPNLNGLESLRIIRNSMYIFENLSLINIDGLSNVDSEIGEIAITSNESLININGLSGIPNCLDILSIRDNDILENIEGVSNFTTLSKLRLRDNNILEDLNGLRNLKNLSFSLEIRGNHRIEHLDALLNLEGFVPIVNISSNENLSNIDGLNSIVEILSFTLAHNNVLLNLNGLSSVNSILENLVIYNNALLMDCCGIQHLLSDPNAIGGTITIENNPSECSSQEEILEDNCSVSTNELSEFDWQISPSVIGPGGILNVSLDESTSTATIEVRNANGQLISLFNISDSYIQLPFSLSSGLYFLTISNDKGRSTKKILVQD